MSMLDEFYDGKLAVYVDKINFQQVDLAKKVLVPFFEGLKIPAAFGTTAERYITSMDSGPCHFISNKVCADGASRGHCKSHDMKIITIYEFKEQLEKEEAGLEMEETDFLSLLGV